MDPVEPDARPDGLDAAVIPDARDVVVPEKKPSGESCAGASECASGHCMDGTCCAEVCAGPCRACNVPGKAGTCVLVAAGAKPHRSADCPAAPAATCGASGLCDGTGGCSKHPAGTVCSPAACAADVLTSAATCDGSGTCRPGSTVACAPYRCVGNACLTRCSGADDCVPGRTCTAGSCGRKSSGQSCGAASECLSGFCADGVCCESACTGPCRSCAGPEALGRCTQTAAGVRDPRGTCVESAVATCGTDGRCDGSGGCRKYPVGTTCGAAFCAGAVATPAPACDVLGRCISGAAMPCAPYACDGTRCATSCTTVAQCVMPNPCLGGQCGKKNTGASCGAASECKSGFCAQGICCAAACNGACRSCALSASLGTCTNVPGGGADPSGTCKDNGPASCGTDGKCNGSGGCRKYADGTVCKAGSCPGGTSTGAPPSRCDGNGSCVAAAPRSCAPFMCDGANARCFSQCVNNAQCVSGSPCQNFSCGKKENGASCSVGQECKSGSCQQGVCCAGDCVGVCRSCAVPGKLGTCSAVPSGGNDPAGSCADRGAATCGTDGKCDGAGACRKYGAGIVCGAPSCPAGSSTLTAAPTCNGAGTCVSGGTSSCQPYTCDGATACRRICSGDAQCVAPNTCQMGTCGKQPLGTACSSGSQCTSGHCVEGVCCSTSSCGACYSCAVSAHEGTCHVVPDGSQDPAGVCEDRGPESCNTDGRCDGEGRCRKYPVGTVCATECSENQRDLVTSTCDSNGSCGTEVSLDCCPTSCQARGGAPQCVAKCASDADCRCNGGDICDLTSGMCVSSSGPTP